MSNLKNIYQSIKSSNPTIDDRLAKQQAWVLRDKMIFEKTAVSSSSSSAGAGGGGSKKINDPSENNYVENNYIDDYFE